MKKSKFLQSSKDMLHRSFKPEKCKTSLRLVASRLKLLRNKKEVQFKQMRREIAQLLESGQDQTARIRVEHVIREEKMMAAYELLALYSELILSRMPIIESQKNCPIDLKEAITSVVFASPRCGDVPELDDVRKQFTAKYGKEFISAAIELRPDSGVSRMMVEKLSAKAPDGQTKLKILTAIAEEHSIKWDPKSFGDNDKTSANDYLNGATTFQDSKLHTESPRYEAPNLQTPQSPMHGQPLKPQQSDRFSQGTQNFNYPHSGGGGGTPVPSNSHHEATHSGVRIEGEHDKSSFSREGSSSLARETWNMGFKDAASAAKAAAFSAEQASMAARAAAKLASRDGVTKPYVSEPHHSGFHVQQDNTAEKHQSSNLLSEQFPKDSTGRLNTGKHPSARNDQDGVVYGNPVGADGKSGKGGYDSTETYSRPTPSRPKTSVYDDSFSDGSEDANDYSRMNLSTQGTDKPEMISSNLSGNSEYEASFKPESFGYMHEKNTIKQTVTSSHPDSNIFADDNDSLDFNHQNIVSDASPGHIVGSDHGHIHRDISWPGSAHPASAVSDESGSDDDKVLYDAGPKYDEQYSDFGFPSSGRTSPSNIFTDEDAQDSGLSNSRPKKSISLQQNSPEKKSFHECDDDKMSYDTGPKYDEQYSDFGFLSSGRTSPSNIFTNPDTESSRFGNGRSSEKSVSSQQNSTEKHSLHMPSEVVAAPLDDLKLEGPESVKFDDSDGHATENEDSLDESEPVGRNNSTKLPRKENHIHSSPRYSSMELGNMESDRKARSKLLSDELGIAEVQRMNNRKAEVNSDSSKSLFSPQSSIAHPPEKMGKPEVAKLSLGPEDEDIDVSGSRKSFEGLVDGETHTSSDLGSKLNFGKLTGGLRHKGYTIPPYTRSRLDDTSYSSKPAEESSSVNFESPDPPAAEFPSQSRSSVNVEKRISEKVQISQSDSDTDSTEDELPVQTSSHRKQYTPKAGNETQPKSRLKGSITYFGSDSEEDLPKQTFSSRTNLGSGLSRRTKANPTSGTSTTRPTREQVKKSDSGAERKSASSFYGTQSHGEAESQTRDSVQSRTPDQSSLGKGSFERMPDFKMPVREESPKTASVEQLVGARLQTGATGSSKSSQVSPKKANTLSSVGSGKKASHVHPKLPDYDDFAAHLLSLRKDR